MAFKIGQNNIILHNISPMNRIAIFFLLFLPFLSDAQQKREMPVYTNDSFKNPGLYFLDTGWRFFEGDDIAMASQEFDDSKWETVHTVSVHRAKSELFSGLGWFRYHIITDTSLTNLQLALTIYHLGASEIYFDGVKINSFGKINGKDGSEYYDPQGIPILLPVMKAGHHVIAVRYANFDAQKNYWIFHAGFRGFRVALGEAGYFIKMDRNQTLLTSLIYLLFFGIFLALAMSHLFLYLYNRSFKANLFFSIFCFVLGIGSMEVFLDRTCHNPMVQLVNNYVTLIVVSAACFSFSGFTNELFGTKKWRLRLISVCCLITPFVWIANGNAGMIVECSLVGTVFAQTIVMTIRAMYKKVSGARILGAGLLFFSFFFYSILIRSIASFNIDENSTSGKILLFTAICAILSIPVSLSLYLAWSFADINKKLKKQLDHVELLSVQTIEQEQEKKRILESQNEMLEKEVTLRTAEIVLQKDKIEKQHDELKVEKKKTDDLLLNILPEEIATELKEKGYSEARMFNDVTVLFTDFVDFTKAGNTMSAQQLVNELHVCFKTFDEIISKYNIEKIKTIGDAYLAVCGLPLTHAQHAEHVANAALEIVQFMAARKQQLKDRTFEVRIGIHSGSVVAGIVGVKKFAYDIWGDTVNTAARMEQNSIAGKINISQATYDLIKNKFECTYRGEINAKNKGELSMYFVDGVRK
jgi:adenylate cyclase